MWVVVGLAYLVMRFSPSLPLVWATFLIAGPIEVWLLRRAWLRSLRVATADGEQMALAPSA